MQSIQRISRLRRGLNQAEVAISTIIVGVLMVTSFTTIAASRRSQTEESFCVRGLAIADALMAEITQLPMREPSCDCGYGPETGETGSNRLNFDDVDDYNGLTDSPPRTRNGTLCDGYSDLSRRVTVASVVSSNWDSTTLTYAGVYRVIVSVVRNSKEVCRLVSYRTSGTQSQEFQITRTVLGP